MKKTSSFSKLAACVGVAACGLVTQAHAEDSPIAHVLLISVDGLHALDVARYVESHPNSALAELSEHGATYTSARTPANSDSFPGLLALVTGGSPVSRDVFYDVSYVQPRYGTVYTGSSKKNAEHGGFSFGDTNVGLIVSNPALKARTVKTAVATSQVAPTILRALGIDPNELQAVHIEHTAGLPGLGL